MIEKFKLTISGIENIINQIETVDEMTLSEFLSLTGPNKVELYELWHSVNLLTLNDSRYSKIFQDIRSVLNFMGDEIQNIEKKNLGVYEFFNTPKFEHWDSQYKKGKQKSTSKNIWVY